MSLSLPERILLGVTLLSVLYRIVKDEWPVEIEVE